MRFRGKNDALPSRFFDAEGADFFKIAAVGVKYPGQKGR